MRTPRTYPRNSIAVRRLAGNPGNLHHPRTGEGLNATDIAYEFGQSRLMDVAAWLDELATEDHVSIRAWRDSRKAN